MNIITKIKKWFQDWKNKRKLAKNVTSQDHPIVCIPKGINRDEFITSKNGIPAFRHTILANSDSDFLHKKLENLVDISIYECEKYYPSFQQTLFHDIEPLESLEFNNFEVIGSA